MKVIDFHTHLFDVCGLNVHPACGQTVKANLLEKLGYSDLLQVIIDKLIPRSFIAKSAAEISNIASVSNLLKEMKKDNIEKSVVLPIEPSVTTEQILNECRDKPSLVPLASIDIARLDDAEIGEEIHKKKSMFPFRGIKFHPNLQRTLPSHPKAFELYKAAQKNEMFVLLHVGKTPFLSPPADNLAAFSNVVHALGQFPKVKFILAHMCGYFDPFKRPFDAIKQFNNVWLETSGASSTTVYLALSKLGHKKIIFGSDWPYGTQNGSLNIVIRAIRKYVTKFPNLSIENVLQDVLYNNGNQFIS